MANTTNYNWETPDDTDLVKDGAAAIRTLGNSIDTTTKNLNPETTTGDIAYRSATANTNTRLAIGSTGQVLTVAAGVPSWATPTDQTPLTTKGDVFTFSTIDARLGVGADGTVLTADSAETTGLKWAAPSGASFAGCVLTNAGSQSIAGSTITVVTFDTESLDTDGYHSTATNTGRITIPSGKAGKYLFTGMAQFTNNGTGSRAIYFYLNGTAKVVWSTAPASSLQPSLIATFILDCAVGDYVEMRVFQSSGGSLNLNGNSVDTGCTNFGCTYLGV